MSQGHDVAARIEQRMADLAAQLRLCAELGGSVLTGPGQPLNVLPGAIIGPPAILWEAYDPDPTELRAIVYVVVEVGDYALSHLWSLVPAVVNVIERGENMVVAQAAPGSYMSGQTQLPAYEITVEVSL